MSSSGAGPLLAAVLIVAGAALGLSVLRRLLPAGTIRARPGLPATILSRGLLTFAFFGADAYVTLTLTTVRHHSPALAGIAVTGSTLGWTAGAWVQARMSERWPGRRLVRTGLSIVLAGIAVMALVLLPTVPVAVGIAAWTVAGFGMGLENPMAAPANLETIESRPQGHSTPAPLGKKIEHAGCGLVESGQQPAKVLHRHQRELPQFEEQPAVEIRRRQKIEIGENIGILPDQGDVLFVLLLALTRHVRAERVESQPVLVLPMERRLRQRREQIELRVGVRTSRCMHEHADRLPQVLLSLFRETGDRDTVVPISSLSAALMIAAARPDRGACR